MMSFGGRTLISADGLASLKIEGLPSTKRGINQRRTREQWPVVEADNRLQLIDVDNLPDPIRSRILKAIAPAAKPKAANNDRRGAGRPKGTAFFDQHPNVAEAVIAWLGKHRYAATTVFDMLAASDIRPLPPIYTLRRYIREIETKMATTFQALRDPDAAKSKTRLALGRADGGTGYAHQVWELDTTKADVMTANGRRMILGVIDRYSRRARFVVATSESAQSVRKLLQRAIADWGVVPATIVVDNGSGYINQTVKTACEMLGIAHKPCPPGSPERKPFVERLFGTFTRQRAVVLPGFTGHNVAQAQQLRARARKETGRAEIFAEISAEELQSILDNWTVGVYEARVHGGIGMAPIAKAQASPIPATAAPSAEKVRQALTAFVGNQIIGKRGLRWKNGRYWCAELAAHIGKPVHVRRDEEELGALLVFGEDGAFIGEALNHERKGVSEQEFAMAGRAHQQAHEKVAKAHVREAMRRYPIERARNDLLRADAQAAGKLAELPQQPTRAVERPAPETPAQIHRMPVAPAAAPADEIAARVARADELLARADSGHDVPAADIAWATAFAAGTAYKWFKAEQDHAAGKTTSISITSNKFGRTK